MKAQCPCLRKAAVFGGPRAAAPVSPRGAAAAMRAVAPGAGFTLIELLVTLVILSTGIVVVLQAFQSAAVGLDEAREVTRGYALAEGKLAEIELSGLEAAGTAGAFDAPHANYRWRLELGEKLGAEDVARAVAVQVWREGSQTTHAIATYIR